MSSLASESLAPVGARLLCRRPVEAKSAGGILIPEGTAKLYAGTRCTVLAVGAACEFGIKPGDEIIISTHGGAWISVSGKGAAKASVETFIISEEDVLAIVRKEPAPVQESAT